MTNIQLLESYFVKDGKSHLAYQMLTETEKKHLSKDLIQKLYSTIKHKSLKINYSIISASKGDITKFSKYDDLLNSIKILERMYNSDPGESPKEILTLVKTHKVLLKYKNDFIKSFANKDELMIMTYNNIVATLIASTSLIISCTMDYIKNPNSEETYKMVFNKSYKTKLKNSIYFESLNKFLTMEIKGELNQIFKNNNKISESFSFDSDEIIPLNENIIGVSLIIIAAILALLFLIRDIVFIFFHVRTKISEMLMQLAYFVEENANSIAATNEKASDNQYKTAEKLRRLSKKIAVDTNDAEKKARKEASDDDKENSKLEDDTATYDSEDDEDILL